MLRRSWVFVLALLGAMAWFPAVTSAAEAPKLAQECIDAKLTTQADCDALLKKLGKSGHKPADKTKAGKPANTSSQPKPALPKVCADAGITTQADCDAYQASEKAKTKASAPPPASSSAPAAPPSPATTVTEKPKQSALPKDCLAAGITTVAACDAFHLSQSTKAKSAPLAVPKPAQPSSEPPASAVTKPKTTPLAKDCLAAGLSTQADCDALHATEAAKLKAATPKTTGTGSPISVQVSQPPGTTPPAPASTATGITNLSKDCVDAGLKTQADCDALHTLQKAKSHPGPDLKGQTSANSTSSAPASQPAASAPSAAETSNGSTATLAQDCVSAGLKTQADCDAYHLTKAKPAKPAGAVPAVTNPASAQPTEVVPVLPKGVAQSQVAPLLDSAKQAKTAALAKGTPAPAPVTATTVAPPPTNDKAAQASIAPLKPIAIDKQPGTPIAPTAKPATLQLPSNVTVINQTTINQTTINQTTINQTIINNNSAQPPVQPQPAPAANPIGLSIGIVLQIGGGQLVVDSSGRDQYRIADHDRDRTYYEQLPGQRYRETIIRPDGTRIVTIYDRAGDVLRRSRFDPDGREDILADYDYSRDTGLGEWHDPGDDLPPLRLQVPVDDYVLDGDQADERQLELFLSRPPVEPLHRLYSISEVERSARLRDILPRVELGDLTFDTGAADLGSDQIGALSGVAHAMLALLQRNPAETFLIEGHTDAVGSDASNLVLSDARAASVAQILTEAYHIPPENLATQGYGDHFLKIQTDGPERLNRRVVIRRITPLVASVAAR